VSNLSLIEKQTMWSENQSFKQDRDAAHCLQCRNQFPIGQAIGVALATNNRRRGNKHNIELCMPRSSWKMPFSEVSAPFSAPNLDKTKQDKPPSKVWSRQSVVLPQFVDNSFTVHNGKTFIPIKVSEEMVGHKFGEFAITRKRATHKTNRRRQVARR
jgi:small subunit ribosomal protein S19